MDWSAISLSFSLASSLTFVALGLAVVFAVSFVASLALSGLDLDSVFGVLAVSFAFSGLVFVSVFGA